MKEKLIEQYNYCLKMATENANQGDAEINRIMYNFWNGKAEGVRFAIDMIEEEEKEPLSKESLKQLLKDNLSVEVEVHKEGVTFSHLDINVTFDDELVCTDKEYF